MSDVPDAAAVGTLAEPSGDAGPGAGPRVEGTGRSFIRRSGLSEWDAGVAVLALLSLVAFAPPLMFDAWTPRVAPLLAAGAVGVVVLVQLVLRRDRAAMILAAALGWTIVSSVLSPAPRSALLGFVGRDLSALTVVAAAGCWALGRAVTERGRNLLVAVVMWAGAAGALMGIVQVLADITSGPLALLGARPTGFYANPVYFGAISSVVLLAAVASWTTSRWRLYVIPLVVGGLATSLSGSRVALAAALVTAGALVLARRTRETAVGAGLAVASLVAGVALDRSVGGGRNAADRVLEGAGGGRTSVWRYGVEAWIDRPLSGYGFGQFRPAVQHRFSSDFVRDYAPDDLTQAWFDPHNVGVGVLVAVGLVGAGLLLGWVFVASIGVRRSGHPLAWALLPLVFHWLLQPVSLVTLPLAMLAFGAAGPRVTIEAGRRHVAGLVVGATLGLGLVAADVALRRAADAADGDRAAQVAELFWDDPIVSDVVAQVWAFDTSGGGSEQELSWRRRAAESEPDRPFWWTQLARTELTAGRVADAEVSNRRALELQPTNARALRTEAMLAIERDDLSRLEDTLRRLCPVSPADCDLDATELIEDRRAALQSAD
jgi:O-antigen ligase